MNSASTRNVGTGFAGFSYEKDRVGAGMFDVNDTNLVNLFKLLGPSVLRLGGNLVDIVNWNANGAGGSATEIVPPDVTKLAAFIQATNWKGLCCKNEGVMINASLCGAEQRSSSS